MGILCRRARWTVVGDTGLGETALLGAYDVAGFCLAVVNHMANEGAY